METEKLTSYIWEEEPEESNPFVAKECYCHGYDVYGDILQKGSWHEYLYLLFKGERPSQSQLEILESVSLVLANPGPKDLSVRAAMNGVGGSRNAACLIAALAVGSGAYMGSTEIVGLVNKWDRIGFNLEEWLLPDTKRAADEKSNPQPEVEHQLGFDPYGVSCPQPVLQSLEILSQHSDQGALSFIKKHREVLEAEFGLPLSMVGVIAAAFSDLNFDPDQAEMAFLILRLPGAAVHALEQKKLGWNRYPYFGDKVELTNDPAQSSLEVVS